MIRLLGLFAILSCVLSVTAAAHFSECCLGADKAKRDLRIIKGRADMAILLKEKGLGDMMSTMETLLPPIVKPGIASLAHLKVVFCICPGSTLAPLPPVHWFLLHCQPSMGNPIEDLFL